MRRIALIVAPSLAGAALLLAAPAISAPPQAGAPTGIGSSSLPLDVTADNGEQFQEEHRAVWSGNVEASQGDERLRTPRLTVYYAARDAKAPKASAGSLGSDAGKVERIEADGPVFYTTPTEKAKGDHATYLASDDTYTLTGNVVLIRDRDVATGDKLVIERKTGHSVLTSNPGKGPSQRVRAVLYPAQSGGASPKPAARP